MAKGVKRTGEHQSGTVAGAYTVHVWAPSLRQPGSAHGPCSKQNPSESFLLCSHQVDPHAALPGSADRQRPAGAGKAELVVVRFAVQEDDALQWQGTW